MDTLYSQTPWDQPRLWEEANAALGRIMAVNREALAGTRLLAGKLKVKMESIFPIMDHLCTITCPQCRDNCCRRAWIWFDFKDLTFLHLARLPIPLGQPMAAKKERCRYITPKGCRLDRIQRPFICTWYLCPAQTQHLDPKMKQVLGGTLKAIKELRRQLESQFIRKTANIPAAAI